MVQAAVAETAKHVAKQPLSRDDDGMRVHVARGWALVLLPFVIAAAGRAQGASWFVRSNDAEVRLVGPDQVALSCRGRTPDPIQAAAGDWSVHFGADALGKPESLMLNVPAGAVVQVAIAAAAAPVRRQVALDDASWTTIAGGDANQGTWQARTVDCGEERDYRVAARGAATGATGSFGVVARWLGPTQHYRFVWDRAHAELRVERQLGPDAYVLARGPAPKSDDAVHELALQVVGFRIDAFCDKVLVAQVLDGAISRGAVGLWASKDTARWETFATSPPALPVASSALVSTPGEAQLVVATAVAAGHIYVVELSLDRPHPLVPTTAEGSELWLLQRSPGPLVLMGDWRGSLGSGVIGQVPRGGVLTTGLHWRQATALRYQALLVSALLVSPNGEVVVGRTPPVPLWL